MSPAARALLTLGLHFSHCAPAMTIHNDAPPFTQQAAAYEKGRDPDRRQRIYENSKYFRGEMKKLGFEILGTDHPIVPVMLGDAKVAQHMSKKLLENGIYAVGFFYPVVPKNKARIRLQINSEHTKEELDKVIDTFKKVGEELNLL